MRRTMVLAFVFMMGRHVARAQGTILEDAPLESPGADSGVSSAPSIAPRPLRPSSLRL
jgi:hypothetical protein